MIAQTETIRKSYDTTTQPPVIIKSGGGGGDPTRTKVTFEGQGKVFDSPRQPFEWQFSRSSVPASIMSLEIVDGPITLGPFKADFPGELAVLEVSYGQETLMVNDTPLRDSQNTEISITSPVPFTITQPGLHPDQWIDSEAQFPNDSPFVLFTQGGHELKRYQCTSIDVELKLHVSWGE